MPLGLKSCLGHWHYYARRPSPLPAAVVQIGGIAPRTFYTEQIQAATLMILISLFETLACPSLSVPWWPIAGVQSSCADSDSRAGADGAACKCVEFNPLLHQPLPQHSYPIEYILEECYGRSLLWCTPCSHKQCKVQ
jgi:hypothetical protein